jgi:hypothetical protein
MCVGGNAESRRIFVYLIALHPENKRADGLEFQSMVPQKS